jgi:porphyrinogen peroxidase
VTSTLTRAATFLVVRVNPGADARVRVRALCHELPDLVRAIGFREPKGTLTGVVGVGATAWDALFGAPRPTELHPFREVRAEGRHAVATPGDLLFHLRADRADLCYELETEILRRLGAAVEPVDEVQGFRYFDNRDLIGFVDGTENPEGEAARRAVLVGDEDARFAGGSYVIVQKYLHDLAAWEQIPVEEQERIIGRKKLSDVELEDAAKPAYAHNVLTKVVVNGEEVKILRDNMPFARPAAREFGTYFIGYARSPATIERMLENMFVGNPPGTYDRILDVSRAVTGSLFFVPSATFLESIDAG